MKKEKFLTLCFLKLMSLRALWVQDGAFWSLERSGWVIPATFPGWELYCLLYLMTLFVWLCICGPAKWTDCFDSCPSG
jgi:hypothetical protein